MHAVVIEGYSFLAFNRKASPRKIPSQNRFINRFQQSRPQLAVDFDRGINHPTGDPLQPLRVPRDSA